MTKHNFHKFILQNFVDNDTYFNDIHFETIDGRFNVYVTRIEKDWIMVNVFDKESLIYSFRVPYATNCKYKTEVMYTVNKFIDYYKGEKQ